MANWQTPKINYDTAYIPGPSDFNRIEGNIQHLKDLSDAGELFIMPSDTVILAADAERGGYGFTGIVKRFRVKYEGVYRIEFQVRGIGYQDIWVSVTSELTGEVIAQHFMTPSYRVYNSEIYVPAGGIIVLSLHFSIGEGGVVGAGYIFIRNVRVKGTLMRRADIPNNAVLQN